MEENSENKYVRRTQKDYSMSFKMQVVNEVERGEISVTAAQHKYGIQGNATVINWLRKYGTFDWENQTPSNMPKTQEQKILELAEKEYNIPIRKKCSPEQSTTTGKKQKRR